MIDLTNMVPLTDSELQPPVRGPAAWFHCVARLSRGPLQKDTFLVWESTCSKCRAPFHVLTPVGVRDAGTSPVFRLKHCEEHRMPRHESIKLATAAHRMAAARRRLARMNPEGGGPSHGPGQ